MLLAVLDDMATNALAVLQDSSQQIRGLFDLIRASPDLNEKLTLFQRLKDDLELYALLEEKIFYPALSSFDEVAETIDRSYEEHDEISDLLEEMDQMELNAVEGDDTFDTEIDDFDDALGELETQVTRHFDREEKELFPGISEKLDEDDLLAIANEMNELRGLGMAA